MKRKLTILSLVMIASLLVTCGPTPAPQVVEKVVTQSVTQVVKETVIVEGTPQVVEKEVTQIVEKQVTQVVELVVTPTPEPPPPPKSTEPVFGGVFKAAFASLPPALDDHSSNAAMTSVINLEILETLVEPAEDYSVTPMLAESWDISDDGLTYTFHLRKGIKFHNGKEMTSADVLASVDRYLQVTSRPSHFEILDSYEATDPYTFVFHLNTPSAAFLGSLALPQAAMSIYPAEIITGVPKGEIRPEQMVGTGPFQVLEIKPDELFDFKRFEDYQPLPGERNGMGGAKIAYFDEVQMIYVPETGARVAGLETGEYDWIEAAPASEIDRINADPNMTLQIFKPSGGAYLTFNHAEKLTGNLKFRQAIQAALDMNEIGLAAYGGNPDLFQLTESIWPPQTVWYFEDDVAKALYNQNDVEKAKQLLAESGYNGEELIIMGNRTSDVHFRTLMDVADQLQKKLGIVTRVEMYDWPGTQAKWAETTGWHISTTGNTTLELLNPNAGVSDLMGPPIGAPVGGHYTDENFLNLFKALDTAATFEERKAALKPLEEFFYENVVQIKAFENSSLAASRSDILGYTPWYRVRFFGVWRQQ